MVSKLSYSELQKALKELRTKGAVLLVKLNAKEVLLRAEYERLTRDYTKEQEAFENYLRPPMQTVRTTPELLKTAAKYEAQHKEAPLSQQQKDELLSQHYARQRNISNREVEQERVSSGSVKRTYFSTPISPVSAPQAKGWEASNRAARQQQYDRRVRDAVKPEPKKVVELPKVKVEYSKKDKSDYYSTYTSKRAA